MMWVGKKAVNKNTRNWFHLSSFQRVHVSYTNDNGIENHPVQDKIPPSHSERRNTKIKITGYSLNTHVAMTTVPLPCVNL